MSRIGRLPITIDTNVQVAINPGLVSVKGPKGELSERIHRLMKVELNDGQVVVSRKSESKLAKSIHGTTQRLIANMVTGVTVGYGKNLDLVGTGYRVQKQGNKLVLSLGFSHPVEFAIPESVQVAVEGNNKILITGISKAGVGQTAAVIRAFKPPEPYKGKGILYEGEVVRRKAGKAAKAA